ncbi:MAG TPA: translation initiation factor IF-2 N-terminal domain-containing protein, partial [Acidimicrobiales bacterium]|nr:translation initiation factor IF-2 N-terminal domain-containing protein [Acidimicrobiales bacterium]
MAKKMRVYELARELGLTNKEGLELCLAMGIGVTSHSSSIEEAQADRVRRKAERDGLKRAHPPEEPQGALEHAAPDLAVGGPGPAAPIAVAAGPVAAPAPTPVTAATSAPIADGHAGLPVTEPHRRAAVVHSAPPGVSAPSGPAGPDLRDGAIPPGRRATPVPPPPGPRPAGVAGTVPGTTPGEVPAAAARLGQAPAGLRAPALTEHGTTGSLTSAPASQPAPPAHAAPIAAPAAAGTPTLPSPPNPPL